MVFEVSSQLAELRQHYSGGSDCSDPLDKMGALAYGVDSHHDRVVLARFREFRDEVYADDVPAFFWNQEWLEFPGR